MATRDFQQCFLPSPPPSPLRRRHHKKKPSDPFFDVQFSSTSPPTLSPPSSPQSGPQEPHEPLVTRILLTPILFTSFLLSLFIINRSDRARRATRPPSIWSYFSPHLWIDPEPYQNPNDSTWTTSSSATAAHREPHDPINFMNTKTKRNSWHLHKKIRKMAKLEVSDALEMRGRVAVMLVAVVLAVAVGLFLSLRWVVGKLWWGR